jgi:hypothetical protein
MNKTRLRVIAAACAIILAVWGTIVLGSRICFVLGVGKSDSARLKALGDIARTLKMLMSMERHLPAGFVSFSHLHQLEDKCMEVFEANCNALVGTGYFTNVRIPIPRAEEPPGSKPYYEHRTLLVRQTFNRIRKALHGHGEYEMYCPANGVVSITCRPQDVPLCVQALRE